VATRYEEKAANYLAFVRVVAMMVMLQEPGHRRSYPVSCPCSLRRAYGHGRARGALTEATSRGSNRLRPERRPR
jgi:hypothetical protein